MLAVCAVSTRLTPMLAPMLALALILLGLFVITRLLRESAQTAVLISLPLFNIWGFFRPSVGHGIGVGGVPKDTAFGLYRDGTELRGIYAANVDAARRVCADLGRFACDYPSLIGNDDFYGGL
eukprot:jgi/Hompol1/2501/HPOL_006023-RA